MNEKGWKRVANGFGILSLLSIVLFLVRLVMGKIDFWTILFFSLIITGALAYIIIYMLIKIRQLTPTDESVVEQVSDTKEFVGLFISFLVLITAAIGVAFFSGKAVGETIGGLLFMYALLSFVIKMYDIQRLTRAKQENIRLISKKEFLPFSQAEKIGLGVSLIGLLAMILWPSASFLVYAGLLVFLIRPIMHRVEGRWIDILLMIINFIMVLVSLLIVMVK